MNPIIIIAVIAQSFIAKSNRMAGAIVGYVITTGILLWGILLYSAGSGIIFFAIPLSETVFILLCLVWYAFNTRSLLAARKVAALRNVQLSAAANQVIPPPPADTGSPHVF